MDRHNRGGDRDGNRHYSRMSGRSSSDRYPNPNNSHHHQQPNYRGGGGGGGFSEPNNARPFNNSHHHNHNQPFGGAPDFRPTAADGGSGGGGFGGGGFSGGGFVGGFQSGPMSGQKRSITGGFPSSGRSHSPNRGDSGNFAKLFIGSVPRTATEEDIRPLFEDQGNVIEVALIKDKRTGQQQGCCFIKYATSEEADQAIRALHNQVTLPGGSGPIQVRYADGERERLGKFQSANEYKLFVGSLNKQATEKEVEEIFSPYGHVEDVYIMRDELKQSRGCGFVKYSHRDMAAAAINALNGIYLMRGCDQPLTVRFADPKRPRAGESRFGPAFGGPGFGSRSQPPSGVRPVSNVDDSLHIPPNAWQPMSPQSGGLSSQVTHAFGSHLPVKGGVGPMSSMTASSMGSLGMSTSGSFSGISSTLSSASQQGYSSMPHIQSFGHQISPLQKQIQSPQHLPSSLQLNSQQNTSSFSQSQGHISQTPIQQFNQIQAPHSIGQPSLGGHALTFGLAGQLSVSQPLVQPSGPQQVPFNLPNLQQSHLPTNNPSSSIQQSQLLQPIQQVPSQGQLQQQVQTLHSGFQSTPPPQQAYSLLQQQLHLMKQTPSTQSISQQQNLHATSKPQSAWTGILPQAVVSTPAASPAVVTSSTISSSGPSAVPIHTTVAAPLTCNWTEHTSPEGYKYYYNSVTGESRWEKPEELSLFEQQQLQQKLLLQQQQQQKILVPQLQSQNQAQTHNQVVQSPQQISHAQHLQLQTQLRQQQQQIQVQQPSLSSSYQASGAIGHQHIQEFAYGQLQPTNASVIDQARLQQGIQAAHERMWKTKPSGT